MDNASRLGLDGRGSVCDVVLVEQQPAEAAERLCEILGDLLLTRLTPVGLDLREVPGGSVVAIVSLCEQVAGCPPRFHAGTALASSGTTALAQAVCGALLRDTDGNILRSASRRAVELHRARAVHVRVAGREWAFGDPSVPPGSPMAALELAEASLLAVPDPSPGAAGAIRDWLARLQEAADLGAHAPEAASRVPRGLTAGTVSG